ncbi:GOLPH3/VPS74 family protein [Pseudonocardia asaccharolytica]|uniref:GOLPH3/VPS74 family protein n=1 Tax=Pseudonocardia asaccharolytica TaxID=54010 RepID=UPI0003FC9CB0|nr:GPP34 family phosphoprotein [Pseudonocardia asaccharolytica]
MVTLAEDLFLLACDDETGRLLTGPARLDLGLGGALLLDLALRERVALVDSHVTVVDPAATGDLLLDAALSKIAGEAKARDRGYWVRHLAKGVRAAVEDRLVAAGVLRHDDHRMLGLIPTGHCTPEVDGRIEHELVGHLHDAVVLGHPASRETAAVASLALAVGLERHLFPRADRRAVRHRMQEIAEGQWVGAAVRQAVVALDAALGIVPSPGWAVESTSW